jgi:hypothetical protein
MVKITKKQFSQGTRYDFSINGHTYACCLCLHGSPWYKRIPRIINTYRVCLYMYQCHVRKEPVHITVSAEKAKRKYK